MDLKQLMSSRINQILSNVGDGMKVNTQICDYDQINDLRDNYANEYCVCSFISGNDNGL